MGLTFDGSNHVNLGTNINMDATTDETTIMAWFRIRSQQQQDQRIFAKGTSQASNAQTFALIASGNTNQPKVVQFRIKTGGNTQILTGTTQLQLGVWHHIAGTRTEAPAFPDLDTVWLDAVREDENQDLGLLTTDSTETWIGDQPTSENRPFLGDVADIRMYNRALSQAELQTIITGKGADGIVAGLQHRWPLADFGPGTIAGSVTDIIGGASGVGVNSPVFVEDILRTRTRIVHPFAIPSP